MSQNAIERSQLKPGAHLFYRGTGLWYEVAGVVDQGQGEDGTLGLVSLPAKGPLVVKTAVVCGAAGRDNGWSLATPEEIAAVFGLTLVDRTGPTQAQAVAALLASLLAADPAACRALIRNRVPCTQAVVDHPSIVVDALADGSLPEVGLLGVLNGLVRDTGWVVSAQYEDGGEDGRGAVLGFGVVSAASVTPSAPQPESPPAPPFRSGDTVLIDKYFGAYLNGCGLRDYLRACNNRVVFKGAYPDGKQFVLAFPGLIPAAGVAAWMDETEPGEDPTKTFGTHGDPLESFIGPAPQDPTTRDEFEDALKAHNALHAVEAKTVAFTKRQWAEIRKWYPGEAPERPAVFAGLTVLSVDSPQFYLG